MQSLLILLQATTILSSSSSCWAFVAPIQGRFGIVNQLRTRRTNINVFSDKSSRSSSCYHAVNSNDVISNNKGHALELKKSISSTETITTSSSGSNNLSSRRSFVAIACQTVAGVTVASSSMTLGQNNDYNIANAAVGTLPEFSDTNSILQGVTIRVADQSQQDAMIKFLEDGFNFQILRKRVQVTIEETWLGFGPEELSIPKDFVLPVSSFAKYGGHASIHIVYDTRESSPYYRVGDEIPPGNNIAYLQVGVPGYRISQMVANGGKILDAYGIVDVVSPAGLPMRGIVGIAPDPMMFIAINCADVRKSRAFYEQLGFIEEEYPFARPNKGQGQFEPPQPPKSIFMAQSRNCMGILLLPSKQRKLTTNPVVQSLNIVYTPSTTVDETDSTASRLVDPSGVVLGFQSANEFQAEEKITR